MAQRLFAIDRLPSRADAAVLWAQEALRERRLTQDEVREQLNWRLAQIDVPTVSRSGFNRWAIKRLKDGFPLRCAATRDGGR